MAIKTKSSSAAAIFSMMFAVKNDTALKQIAPGHLKRDLNGDPNNFVDMTLLATQRFFEGQPEKAAKLTKAALAENPEFVPALFLSAEI